MKILILDPYHKGSHARWAKGIANAWRSHFGDEVHVWSLPGRHWKWRMHGASGAFALRASLSTFLPDVILSTDMLDVAGTRGSFPPHWRTIPWVLYFHENQLTYPWSSEDKEKAAGHNRTYEFINISSANAADRLWFNSTFHLNAFLPAVDEFLSQMPDEINAYSSERLRSKATAIPPGITPTKAPTERSTFPDVPVILWNHRWEYDKGPEMFYSALRTLHEANIEFKLILCGEQFRTQPPALELVLTEFSDRILHTGYAKSRLEYEQLLRESTFIIHQPHQEYFGISVAEAMSNGVIPLLHNSQAYSAWVPEAFLFNEMQELSQKWQTAESNPSSFISLAYETASQFFWPRVAHIARNELIELLGK